MFPQPLIICNVPRPIPGKVLSFDSTTNSWGSRDVNLMKEQPDDKVCYIFLENGDDFKKCLDSERRFILAKFGAPDFVSCQMATDLNGYFGCKSSINTGSNNEASQLDTLRTWSRVLTKRILQPEEPRAAENKDYVWYEMGFFTHWVQTGTNRILCIGTPPSVRNNLINVLPASSSPELADPFAMLYLLFDEVLKLCDENTWRVAREVRRVEKSRSKKPSFEELCDLDRHARHLVEVEAVAVETMQRMVERQETNFKFLPTSLTETYKDESKEHLQFQLQIMRSLRWRAQASSERLGAEINLAYNLLVSLDSQIMKSITLLTMIFLPATFVSALFSTTFFNFSEEDGYFSGLFWIYWVVTIPMTLGILLCWWVWLGGSYESMRTKMLRNK